MASGRDSSESRGTGATLPIALLLVFVTMLGGVVIWLSLEGAPPRAPVAASLTVELDAAPAPDSLPIETATAPAPGEPAASPVEPSPPTPPEALAPPPAAPPDRAAVASPPAPVPEPPREASPAEPSVAALTPETPAVAASPSWQTFARPFDRADQRPRIAIVIVGLGTSSAATEATILGLPGSVSLSFWPYADRLDHWIRLARAAGHEVLLNLPMEPENYPEFDPGPKTLLTTLPPEQNLERLDWALSRATGYVGVADYLGARFTASRRDLRPVLEAIHRRGLMFVDSRPTAHSAAPEIAQVIGLPWVANTRFIDEPQVSRDAIDSRLKELESIARLQGRALGIGSPYPVTLERIAAWIPGLAQKGFAVAPVTALVADPPAR